MGNKNPILGIGLLAGGGLLLAQMMKTPADETDTKTNTLGFTGNESDTEFEAKLLSTIKGNKELQRLLTGAQGATGATGATGTNGTNGATGPAGEVIQNYGQSLLKNGACEDGTTNNWTGTNHSISVDTFEGMPIHDGLGFTSDTFIWIRTDRIYKADFYIKGNGNYSLYGNLYNKAGALEAKTTASVGAYFKGNATTTSSFVKTTGYIGGVGAGGLNVSANAVKIKVAMSGVSGALISIAKLVISTVSLGEPVPYNVGFLPTGQMVYDPTTWVLGVYNGTAVVWS